MTFFSSLVTHGLLLGKTVIFLQGIGLHVVSLNNRAMAQFTLDIPFNRTGYLTKCAYVIYKIHIVHLYPPNPGCNPADGQRFLTLAGVSLFPFH